MPFGCAPRCVGAARAWPLRLPLTADVFGARFDRFLAMSSLPFLDHRRHCRRDQLAMRAALALSLVQWSYRGALDYVSSTIRRRRSFTPICGHFVAAL